jgi:2-(1,2-epoxy-1,2-dihydrophenyl)acetyl-CoA isomerase
MEETVQVTKAGAVATVLLNRPGTFNAFDLGMISSLAAQLIGLGCDPAIRAVVLSGQGRAFCAGGDLKWALAFPEGAPAAFRELAARFHLAVLEIRRMPKPVIAAVNGTAAGGGFSLALACDLRVMSESATLRQAYTSSGLCIDGAGTFSLPRLVGLARALEIAALDKPISSQEALAWGLATRVVADGKTLEEAMGMAQDLSRRSIHAFGRCKQLLTDAWDTPLETQMERERQALSACAAHPEGQEGLRAFAERRKPVFT